MLINYIKNNQNATCYFLIFALALLRALTSRILPCLPDFDCNAYIQMANTIAYDPTILPHHAMRVLPSIMAHGLHMMGLSLESAFRVLSDGTYVLFGGLTFWVLRQFKVNTLIAFSITLLCLAPHHAMRIPLQNVYQLCDIMTYPIALMLIYFSINLNSRWVFLLAIIGLLTKQTVFGLGGLSLLYCFSQTRKIEDVFYMVILGVSYLALSQHYHAFDIVTHHLLPNSEFFSVSHLWWVLQDSKLIELFIPILPFVVIYFKQIVQFLIRYWHVAGYMAVIIGQPFVAYHLTGNNFARLALQGGWILYFIIGLSISKRLQDNQKFQILFALYTLAIYFTWGVSQRLVYMMAFTLFCLIYLTVTTMLNKKARMA
ncbi:MAG: hypothetical protein AB7V32_01265 [Candidatus Berkiella sp.]